MSEVSGEEPQHHDSDEPPKRHWEATEPFIDMKLSHWVEVILTAALIFVGVVQIYVYVGQSRTMRLQLAEMENQRLMTVVQMRPNLVRGSPAIHPTKADGSYTTKDGDTINGWDFNPVWENNGESDAENVISWWTIEIDPIVSLPKEPDGRIQLACTIPDRPATRLPVIVQRGSGLVELAQHLSVDDANKAIGPSPSVLIRFVGRIEYDDIFPGTKRHFLNWCLLLQSNDLKASAFSFLRLLEESDDNAKSE